MKGKIHKLIRVHQGCRIQHKHIKINYISTYCQHMDTEIKNSVIYNCICKEKREIPRCKYNKICIELVY